LWLTNNKATHVSTKHFPFDVCYCLEHLTPYDFLIALPSPFTFNQEYKQDKASSIMQNLAKIHARVDDTLHQTQAKYKNLHNVEYNHVGDKVWFHLDQILKNPHH
jgi:hypothetical protein